MMTEVITNFMGNRNAHADFARCRQYLEDALELAGGTHAIEDIIVGVQLGAYHFWPGRQAAAITEVHAFPRARVLNVFLAGGDLDEIMDMEPLFASWGAYLGCSHVSLTGRPGWERVLKGRGWHRAGVVLSRKIDPSSMN